MRLLVLELVHDPYTFWHISGFLIASVFFVIAVSAQKYQIPLETQMCKSNEYMVVVIIHLKVTKINLLYPLCPSRVPPAGVAVWRRFRGIQAESVIRLTRGECLMSLDLLADG